MASSPTEHHNTRVGSGQGSADTTRLSLLIDRPVQCTQCNGVYGKSVDPLWLASFNQELSITKVVVRTWCQIGSLHSDLSHVIV